jgi:phospholipid transport system substrate-binding protein
VAGDSRVENQQQKAQPSISRGFNYRELRTATRVSLLGLSRPPTLALVSIIAIVLIAVRAALAGPPTDAVMTNIDRVIGVLEDPNLKSQPRERLAAVRRIASEIFDVRETARRSLGRHWQERTPAEREEFVRLFSDLLEATYLSKIEGYGGEKILAGGDTVEGEQATVRTKVITKKGTEIAVDYRLLRRSETWKIYDVNIEGVSLVANYRAQFDRILQTSSYENLVQRLRDKQSDFAFGAKPSS